MIFHSLLRSSSLQRRTTSLAGVYMAYQITRPCSTTFMEAPSATSGRKSGETTNTRTPTLFYPNDVYYNLEAKSALARIRSLKRDELPDDLSLLKDSADPEVAKSDDVNNKSKPQEQHRKSKEPGPKTSESTMGVLNRSGNKHSGTMTLIGYKGGTVESQINQDRSMVAVPFFISDEERVQYHDRLSDQDGGSIRQQQRKDFNEETSSPKQSSTSNSTISSRLLGVFDGHAKFGERVSQYTVVELPKLLATKLRMLHDGNRDGEEEDPDDVVRILKETFVEIDKSAPADISGGCTASVILQRNSKVYVANAGDSRSFLVVYRPSRKTVEVIYISREDKPHLREERKRVERMGGEVWLPVVGSSRVLYTDPETGMQSGLAMSRSIGDWQVGELGVIAEPIVGVLDVDEIVQTQIEKDCQIPDEDQSMDSACFFSEDDVHVLAVSASDGLMDFATPEMVAQTLAVSLYHKDGPHVLTALEQLIYVAAHGWEQTKQGRYRDDISVAVAEIRRPPIRKRGDPQ